MINTLRSQWAQYGFLVFLALVFLTGGSSRAETASLLILRPASLLLLAWAVATTPAAVWRDNKALLALAFGWAALTAAHLLPLPPAAWQALPGRDLAASIDAAAGLPDLWRPLSLVPWRTLNALFALAVPLAVLLFALRLRREQWSGLVFLLLAVVVASAVLGLLQIIGGAGNPFYTYRVTNPDSGVGLLANRNHNAVLLSLGFPLIAATLSLWTAKAEHVRLREWAGAGAGVLLIPFILTTQSRAGILVALLCAGLAWWTYRSPAPLAQKRRPRRAIDPRLVFGLIAGAALVALTLLFTATNAVERLGRLGQEDDELRWQIWPPIWRMATEYLPWGSGIGTFVEVYQIDEPAALLQPSYINHAHNDWLELLLTGGLPAAALLLASLAWLVVRGWRNLRTPGRQQEAVLRRLGVSICAVLALASVYDYPLRAPAMAALLALAVAMLAGRLDGEPFSRASRTGTDSTVGR